jgi:hypothetical protein
LRFVVNLYEFNNSGPVFAGVIWGFGINRSGQTLPSYFEVNQVRAGKGYWIYIDKSESVSGIVVNGITVPPELDLITGWNLVGPTTLRYAKVPPILLNQELPSEISQPIQYWDPTLNDNVGSYIPALKTDPKLEVLEILKGYWIYSSNDLIFILDTVQ